MRERREVRNGLNALLVLIAASVLFLYLFGQQITRSALFVPGEASYGLDETIRLLPTEDGLSLAVYWAPSAGARKTVFYFHGNAEDLGDSQILLSNYRLQGFNVLSFDYRGYGLSEGSPSEGNTFRDAAFVLQHAEKDWGVDPGQVVLHGRSLGGAVAIDLATRRSVGGLILESTFLSAYRVYLPFNRLPGDKYLNYKKAPKLECPTLVIHGRGDRVVPFAHGEELAELVPASYRRTLWLDGGHNDLERTARNRYWSALRGFVSGI